MERKYLPKKNTCQTTFYPKNFWVKDSSQIYRELFDSWHKGNEKPDIKMSKRSKEFFIKELILMEIKHLKRCSTSYVIRELQIKTTTRKNI